jgi:hypothetical protein
MRATCGLTVIDGALNRVEVEDHLIQGGAINYTTWGLSTDVEEEKRKIFNVYRNRNTEGIYIFYLVFNPVADVETFPHRSFGVPHV